MTAQAFRSGDTGCGTGEYGHGVIRGGAQAWHWRVHGYEQLIHGQRNANLEPDKNGFRGNKENNDIVSNV